jgi:PhnB protein
MKALVPFLTFNGNCGEAAEFYRESLGAELFLVPFPEAPDDSGGETSNAKGRIMRATLMKGPSTLLMAGDAILGRPFQPSSSFSMAVHCETLREAERLFAALGEKGTVATPLQTTPGGASFGALTDRFGINWLFHIVRPA